LLTFEEEKNSNSISEHANPPSGDLRQKD